MKVKTIRVILRKKHQELVNSIEDENVRKLVDKNSIITGGCITSMLLNEKVNDFDYYFTDKETVIAVANYYINKFNELNPHKQRKPSLVVEGERVRINITSAGVVSEADTDFETVEDPLMATDYVEQVMDVVKEEDTTKPKYRPVFLSDNAITLSNKAQLIIRFYGNPETIHSNYDFIHATCYWTSKDGHLELPQKALESIVTRELIYSGSKYPIASVMRTRKFIQRGWTINAGQYLKMVMQINDLNLKDIRVLEDQLTGMDVAYFLQILDYIKERKEKDPDFVLSSAYLIETIDRMF